MTKEATAPTKMRKLAMLAALCSGLAPLAAVAQTTPTLISGTIDSQVVRIGVLPVAPKVTLDLHGDTEQVSLYFTGPGGQQFDDHFVVSEPNGKSTFDGAGVSSAFSLYTPAGTWTLTSVFTCTFGRCNVYTGAKLTPLFPSLTFMVVNPHSDTAPPTINSAVITKPTVKPSKYAKIEVEVNIQDDISGATVARVAFSNGSTTLYVGGGLSHTVKSPALYRLTDYCQCNAAPPGIYTATAIYLVDAAGNNTTITDAGQISSLFGGQPTFTLTN